MCTFVTVLTNLKDSGPRMSKKLQERIYVNDRIPGRGTFTDQSRLKIPKQTEMHESSEVRLVKWHRKTYSKSEPEKNIYLCLASQKLLLLFYPIYCKFYSFNISVYFISIYCKFYLSHLHEFY